MEHHGRLKHWNQVNLRIISGLARAVIFPANQAAADVRHGSNATGAFGNPRTQASSPPFFGLEFTRVIGVILILAGVPGLVDSFARFALQGLGTPRRLRRPAISS